MEFKLKADQNIDVDKLVETAGQSGFFYDNDGPNDYGEILRLYQIGKQLKAEYEIQHKNTYIREKELKDNIKYAAIFLGVFVGMIVLDIVVKYIFGCVPDNANTVLGFLAFMHFGLLFLIAIGAVLVAVPFTVNLLKQIYLYRMLTDRSHGLDDDREKFKVITLADERRFLEEKIAEYYRLFGALDQIDKNCKGVFYSYENKDMADEVMASYDERAIADMHKFSNVQEFRANSTVGKDSISAWWILAGAMIPLVFAILVIGQGLADGSGMIP